MASGPRVGREYRLGRRGVKDRTPGFERSLGRVQSGTKRGRTGASPTPRPPPRARDGEWRRSVPSSRPSSLSVLRRNEPSVLQRGSIVIGALHRAGRQLHLLARHLLRTESARAGDGCSSGARAACRPRGRCTRARTSCRWPRASVARPRVLEPAAARVQIRRAELPLAQRVLDAGLEAALLLRLAHLEPVLDQLDPVVDDVVLELGTDLEKALVLRLRCRTPARTRRRPGCTSCGRRSRSRRPRESAAM